MQELASYLLKQPNKGEKMAAKTPSSVITENFGSATLYKASFTAIDNDDTWVSAITSVIGQWLNPTDDPSTQTYEGIDVTYTQATGTFTFRTAEADRAGDLYVLARN